MAGTEVLMAPTALMMIHNPATIAMGDHEDMKKAISMLDEVKERKLRLPVFSMGLNDKLDDTTCTVLEEETLYCSIFSFTTGYTPYGDFLDGHDGYWYGFGGNYGTDCHTTWLLMPYLATINNLSQAIVKNADKTMKITYTLTEQEPSPTP